MANEFKKNVGAPISKSVAEEWIAKYDKERKKDTKSVFFGRDAIQAILSDTRVTGISFFFARKFDDGQKKDLDSIVMVGTTEDGTLLWSPDASNTGSGPLMTSYDDAYTCPPYCPKK